jgi:hypothetical protein
MTDPETLARRRWKQAAAALDTRDRIVGLHGQASSRLVWLRERLPQAEYEARVARAQAIVEGKPSPKNDEVPRLRDELVTLEDEIPALGLAVDVAGRVLWTLRRDNQAKWEQEQARTVARARRLVEEEGGRKHRQTLAEEEALLDWIAQTPQEFPSLEEVTQRAVVSNLRAEARSRRHAITREIRADRIDRLTRGFRG